MMSFCCLNSTLDTACGYANWGGPAFCPTRDRANFPFVFIARNYLDVRSPRHLKRGNNYIMTTQKGALYSSGKWSGIHLGLGSGRHFGLVLKPFWNHFWTPFWTSFKFHFGLRLDSIFDSILYQQPRQNLSSVWVTRRCRRVLACTPRRTLA